MQNPSHKLYILVDKRLYPSQIAVQACHAAIEFAKAHPEWQHQSIVILGVYGERELMDYLEHFKDLKHTAFRESFWDNRLTAVACHGCDDLVKDLQLV